MRRSVRAIVAPLSVFPRFLLRGGPSGHGGRGGYGEEEDDNARDTEGGAERALT